MGRQSFRSQLFSQLPKFLLLGCSKIVLLILAVKIQQVEAIGTRYMKVDYPGPAAFALTSPGIGDTKLPQSATVWHDSASIWVFQEHLLKPTVLLIAQKLCN